MAEVSKDQHRVPINKGNYSMDTPDREQRFEAVRGEGWEDEYREYRRQWIDLPRDAQVRDYPLLVDLELSSACNLSCPMCFTTTKEFKTLVKRKMMDITLFQKVIDEISGKVPALRMSFRGEPTLHPQFIECLQYAKDAGIPEVSFLTNGVAMTSSYFEKVMMAGADWITFSIDGLKESYESVRAPLKFDDIVSKLHEAKNIKKKHGSRKPVIKVQAIWPAIRERAEEFYNTFAPCTDLIAYNPLIDYLDKDEQDLIQFEDDFRCPQIYQRLLVGADGKTMMCSNDELSTEVTGDANTQTIHEIWHGKKITEIRQQHLRCQGFKDIPVCRGCYLPRKTEDSEVGCIHGRSFNIPNYINRSQEIGT